MQIRLEVPDRCQNVQTARLDWPFYVILISRYTIYYLTKFSHVFVGPNWHISQLSNLFISDAIWESFYSARNLAFFHENFDYTYWTDLAIRFIHVVLVAGPQYHALSYRPPRPWIKSDIKFLAACQHVQYTFSCNGIEIFAGTFYYEYCQTICPNTDVGACSLLLIQLVLFYGC